MAFGLALVAPLAACENEPEAPKPAERNASSDNMSDMPMAPEMRHGKSVGTVTAIDTAKGPITLDHGDIAELQWPAMTMGFAVRPEMLSGIKVADKVDFEIAWSGKAGTETRI